jgi:hypothetical protein
MRDQGFPLKISNPEIDEAEFFSAVGPSFSESDESRVTTLTAIEFEGERSTDVEKQKRFVRLRLKDVRDNRTPRRRARSRYRGKNVMGSGRF